MINDLKQIARAWPGEVVVIRRDDLTDSWIFVALHSSVLGTPVGGTRMKVYPEPAAGLRDALRLAEGMTYKWASIGLDKGGGKAVLALSRPLDEGERVHLLQLYADLVESMDGAFGTGEDLGTTPDDMAIVAGRCRFVHGVRTDGLVTDPGPFTAEGVFHGIRAAFEVVLGREVLENSTVLIQGLGDVGEPLARRLAKAGVRLLLNDLEADRATVLATELGAEVVTTKNLYDTECDLFAPCAVGGILDQHSIARLRCRLVAGSANNQLATPEDGQRLHDRGIVYAPDYVINAGGALALGLPGDASRSGTEASSALMDQMVEIGNLVRAVLDESRRLDLPPSTIAQRRAEHRVNAARAAKTAATALTTSLPETGA
jgi:leucine dehydrogenase